MEFLDQVGTRQAENIVVALEVVRVAAETLAAEIGLRELAGLRHRPLGALEDDDALLEQAAQFGVGGRDRLGGSDHRGISMYRRIKI